MGHLVVDNNVCSSARTWSKNKHFRRKKFVHILRKIFFSISSGMLGEIHGKFKSSPHEYWCLSKRDMREKDLEHCEQLYFLTTECVWRCARKFDRSAKARSQLGHLYGFSPVCVRMWPCSSHGRLKAFPQMVHLHGRVCVRMCIFNAPRET